MTGDFWIAKTPGQFRHVLEQFRIYIEERGDFPIAWQAKKYTGARSMDQNSLLQVWSREYARHVLKRDEVTEAEQEAMRITLQRACYAATGWDWLIEHVPDLFTGETKPQRRSTTKFSKGEMTELLSWIQHRAAEDGLILESLGEYAELQAAQVA